MIVCVKVFPKRACFPASNDPSGATVTRAGRLDSEFTIIPALLFWQKSFIIPKNSAILIIWKRSTLLNQKQGLARFTRQFGDMHQLIIRRGPGENVEGKREGEREKQRVEQPFAKGAQAMMTFPHEWVRD
jgi:hypothetical protein